MALPFAAACAYALEKARYGIDLADEGFYLSAPSRIAAGDLPFRDELLTPHRSFDVLLAPVFAVFPDVTLYQYRLLGAGLLLLAAFALYRLLRRFATPVVVAAACAAAALAAPRVFSPGYHLLSACALCASFALWAGACLEPHSARRAALAVAGGTVAFAGAVAYLPFAAMLAVPGLTLAGAVVRGRFRGPSARASWVHLATFAVLTLGALAAVAHLGLIDDWRYADAALRRTGTYRASAVEKLREQLEYVPYALAVLVPACGVAFALGRVLASSRRTPPNGRGVLGGAAASFAGLAGAALLAGLSWGVSDLASPFSSDSAEGRVVVALSGWGLLLGALLAGRRTAPSADWRFVRRAAVASAGLFVLIQVALSGDSHKAAWAFPLVYGVAVVELFLAAGRTRRAAAGLASLSVAGAVLFFAHDHRFVYRSGPASAHTEEFTHPKLRGILGHPGRVLRLQETLAFLEERIEPGDYLLAYDHVPLFYYLTGTRPALNTVWLSKRSPPRVRLQALQYMTARGRVPKYCVRNLLSREFYAKDAARDPLSAFLLRNYGLVSANRNFEVWEHFP